MDESPTDTTTEKNRQPTCAKLSVSLFLGVLAGCVFLYLGKGYIHSCLLWMEGANPGITVTLFAISFLVVAFPLTWGYILLNVAAGYLYGVLLGVLCVATCACCGIFVAHVILRRYLLHACCMSRIVTDSFQALLQVVEGDNGFKVVFLSRLTAVPFGLQNGIFAMSNIQTYQYLCASVLGLLPTQGINAYIGSTLRSMEEVLEERSSTTPAYVAFSLQIVITIGLSVYCSRLAKVQLRNTVQKIRDRGRQSSLSDDGVNDTLTETTDTSTSVSLVNTADKFRENHVVPIVVSSSSKSHMETVRLSIDS